MCVTGGPHPKQSIRNFDKISRRKIKILLFKLININKVNQIMRTSYDGNDLIYFIYLNCCAAVGIELLTR